MRYPAPLLFLAFLAPVTLAQTQGADVPGDYVTIDSVLQRDRIESDGRLKRSIDMHILLRDGAAVAQWGQIGLPYVDGFGDVTFENVLIEKAGGRRIEVKDGKVEDINPFGVSGLPIAADVHLKKLTIPGLEPGDRLSYRIVLTVKPLAPGRVFGEIRFSGVASDPLQVYELDMPRDAGIKVELKKELDTRWEEVPAAAGRLVRRLKVRPKRHDSGSEPLDEAASAALERPDVAFSNFASWSDVAEWWWRLSKDRLAPDAAIRAEAARLVAGASSPRAKLEALHAFVAGRVRYLSVSFGVGRMQPRLAGSVLSNKYGDCKDKFALLAALANAVGLDVRPVLVHSARKNLQDEVPGPQQFDHMIGVALLGSEPKDWLWLDTTNDLGLPGYLLPLIRNKPALLIEANGKGRIVRTPENAPFPQHIDVDVKGSLDAAGPLRAHVRWLFRSDSEVWHRSRFRVTTKDRYVETIKGGFFADGWKDATFTNVTTSDPSDLKEPFRVEFDVENATNGGSADKEWAFRFPLPALDSDLPAPRRKVAADETAARLQVRESNLRGEIQLPEGVSGRPPLSVSLERPFAQLRSEYAVDGSVLKASRRLVILKAKITADEAAGYESFRQAVDKDHDQEFSIDPSRGTTPSAVSAEMLHKEGVAAFDKRDFVKAVEILEKAVAADPKVTDGFEDLGRALREAGRREEALQALTRQIEIDPFHEYAYSERAFILLDLKRTDEAEKDLLKQIDVAPFKAWSYRKLGNLRMNQGRYDEAARYYAGAAAIEPKAEENWASLGLAHAFGHRLKDAAAAFSRARELGPDDSDMLAIASGYNLIGETKLAAEVSLGVLPKLAKRLSALSSARFGDEDLSWTRALFETWHLIGAGALASGETARGERFLESAWEAGFVPEAAWRLGVLRQQQKRAAEAAVLWSAAKSVPEWWNRPDDFATRLSFVNADASDSEAVDLLNGLRIVTLSGKATDNFTEEVLLLVGASGQIEGAQNLSKKNPAAFDRLLPRLRAMKVPLPHPEESSVKIVRRGLLTCLRDTACSLTFDLPGTRPLLDRSH